MVTDYSWMILLATFAVLAYRRGGDTILFLISSIYGGLMAYQLWDTPTTPYQYMWGIPLALFSVYCLFKFCRDMYIGEARID